MECCFLMKKNVTMSNEKLPQVEDLHVLAANYCLNLIAYNQACRSFPQDALSECVS